MKKSNKKLKEMQVKEFLNSAINESTENKKTEIIDKALEQKSEIKTNIKVKRPKSIFMRVCAAGMAACLLLASGVYALDRYDLFVGDMNNAITTMNFSNYKPIVAAAQKIVDDEKPTLTDKILNGMVELVDGEMKETAPMALLTEENKALYTEEGSVAMEQTAPVSKSRAPSNDMGGGEVSKTNTQVEGVDEADIIKSDGKYIYTIKKADSYYSTYGSSDDTESHLAESTLNIISIENPSDMKVVYNEKFSGGKTISEMYLVGDKLVIIGRQNVKGKICSFTMMYDITSRVAPKKVRELSQDGSYISSRMIGNTVYLISEADIPRKDKYEEDDVVPTVYDNCVSEERRKIASEDIVLPSKVSELSYTIVSETDIADDKKPSMVKATFGSSDTVYSSRENLYVVAAYNNRRGVHEDLITIMKFSLTGGMKFDSSVKVAGRVLNQYSMDEYKGDFYIATTHRNSSGVDSSGVYAYDKNFKKISDLTNLAPTESIYSVRYKGDKIYMVTFRQTDPLFVIDRTSPAKIKVEGELKIPGFSNYMHPYSNNIMLGFGEDGDENGTNGLFKVSLFDVTNPEEPKEVQTVVPFAKDNDYTYSEIQNNPKALMFSKEKNIIGFPMSLDYYDNEGYYTAKAVFVILGINEKNRLYIRGAVTQSIGDGDSEQDENPRGIFVDDTLFTVSERKVIATSLKDFKKIKEIKLK